MHHNLPVYRASYDFLRDFFLFSKHIPKEYKYTVGEKIKNEAVEMTLCIVEANASREGRKEKIQKGILHLERIRLLMRLLKDTKNISLKSFAQLSLDLETTSRQLTGWKNYQQNGQSRE